MFTAPKGVPEYFPPRSAAFLAVREALSAPAQHAGYEYVELAVFEDTGLFVRGVGESTDVVSKEMYTFTDRGDRSLSLRPEGTAGVMRMVVEQRLDKGALPIKLWYAGPFFRAERPQHGRYRQLQQVGIEAIGIDDPALDAEVVALADEAYRKLGLTQFTLNITSLGCGVCRPDYRERLTVFLDSLDLDEATRERAVLNPLRVLDDKRDDVQSKLIDAPLMV
ncbi:MAG: histidine--tRNA ligase, partial [Candidatus Nanopelagicales bacterium]|nr:histidine--tRNA ligase [Candidatus Nanopelagicales bacterium]